MDSYKNIIYKKEEGIAYITFNRPKVLNAMNREVIDELDSVLADLEQDDAVLAVILTGEGKAFVAGADIAAMRDYTPAEGRAFNLRAQQVLNRLEALPRPVICAINGYALGGGLEVAMACDIRIMAEHAKVGQPEVVLGIFPGWGGTQRLPRLINAGNAKYYIYTAEQIDSARAYQLGLVQKVVPAEQLMDTAKEIAGRIMANGPIAVRMAKRTINEGMNMGLIPAISFDSETFATVFTTEDRVNGMTAFLNKEKPKFENR